MNVAMLSYSARLHSMHHDNKGHNALKHYATLKGVEEAVSLPGVSLCHLSYRVSVLQTRRQRGGVCGL